MTACPSHQQTARTGSQAHEATHHSLGPFHFCHCQPCCTYCAVHTCGTSCVECSVWTASRSYGQCLICMGACMQAYHSAHVCGEAGTVADMNRNHEQDGMQVGFRLHACMHGISTCHASRSLCAYMQASSSAYVHAFVMLHGPQENASRLLPVFKTVTHVQCGRAVGPGRQHADRTTSLNAADACVASATLESHICMGSSKKRLRPGLGQVLQQRQAGHVGKAPEILILEIYLPCATHKLSTTDRLALHNMNALHIQPLPLNQHLPSTTE